MLFIGFFFVPILLGNTINFCFANGFLPIITYLLLFIHKIPKYCSKNNLNIFENEKKLVFQKIYLFLR